MCRACPGIKKQGKIPKRIHKAERERRKREQFNELFLELADALGNFSFIYVNFTVILSWKRLSQTPFQSEIILSISVLLKAVEFYSPTMLHDVFYYVEMGF